jgi:fumarate hydratase class I
MFETAEKPALAGERLAIPPSCLEALAEEAAGRIAFLYRRSHLGLLAAACFEDGTTAGERAVIRCLLENACVSAEGRLPLCQDTGTACVYGWKDEGVITGADDVALIEQGIAAAYGKRRLRASQIAPVSFFEEYNTGNNLPAQIRIEAAASWGGSTPVYRFLFVAKGGGSSNKTAYFSFAPSFLSRDEFDCFLQEKITALGTSACPPYRLAVVVGGSSPEQNLEILKLATTELLDEAAYFDTDNANAERFDSAGFPILRDSFWENRAKEIACKSGLGAQAGGERLLLDARVFRLPRHAASCPVSIGVSCAAHRNMLAFIDERGVFLEKLEENPREFLNEALKHTDSSKKTEIETRRVNFGTPVTAVCAALSHFKTDDTLLVSGKLLVARDAAHLAWRKLLEQGKPLPEYLFRYPVFYAGPSETPAGCVTGSIGPTTSARMDGFADELLSRGASLVTVGKGSRSALWSEAARKYGGRYLAAPGGAAALIASRNIVSVETIDYSELAMEAVRLLEVKDLLLFVN